MPRFFPQNPETRTVGTFAEMESRLREEQASGLIETQLSDGRQAYLFFEGGAVVGAYTVENSLSKPIAIAELTASANKGEIPSFSAHLPDKARRMAWLCLESQAHDNLQMQSGGQWEKQMQQWKTECLSGLVEVRSQDLNGFFILWQGEVLKSESIFSHAQGFTSQLPSTQSLQENPWNVVTYTTANHSLAHQCFILRQGAEWWGNKILTRYQGMVGRKLLQIMTHELNLLIEPWHWNISFADNTLQDAHFFSRPTDAANAYRTLFMEMGTHMSFVIGNMLTRRLLNETFAQVAPEERAALELQRLIPAAFSD